MRKVILALLLLALPICVTADRRGILTARTAGGGGGGSWSVTTPSTPIAGFRAEDISGTDGDLITTWTAQYGPNASNSGGSVRPTLKTNGPKGGSQKVLSFNADNLTYLQTANFSGGTVSQPYTISITFSNWARTSFNFLFDGNDATLRCFMYDQGGSMNVGATTTGLAQFASDESGWHNLILIINGASSEYSIDNSAFASLTDPGSAGIDGLTLGAREDTFNNSYYHIESFYLWSGAFGSSDKASATNYFNGKIR